MTREEGVDKQTLEYFFRGFGLDLTKSDFVRVGSGEWVETELIQKRKARSLQKLILKSRAAKLLLIRKITQLNAGKKTAGVDGKAKLTFKERFETEPILQKFVNNWKHNKLREIPIPKKKGSTRKLKIPTMIDRYWQCLALFAYLTSI